MLVFETILGLLFAAAILSVVARRVRVPYPTLLALAGALVALIPGSPGLDPPPELVLALFVAPVLLDAAYDASLRDLRQHWRVLISLAVVAVFLTTLAVALAARQLLPDLPWAAAIALGALVAPPDAVAALAVLRQVRPPHRARAILEGESLLNDASALLIYKLAVGAMVAGSFSATRAAPMFVIVVFGSAALGWALAWLPRRLIAGIEDAPTSVILQFVSTFGVWLVAERLGLSAVVTVVVYGLALARPTDRPMSARLRVASFAIWETATVVLNIVAFTLIGLQIRPIVGALDGPELVRALSAAAAILGVVIVVRVAWIMTYYFLGIRANRLLGIRSASASLTPPSAKEAFVVAWSGMRGIVTLATAMALPAGFPYRDVMQMTAFVVVLGTLLIQGLTLRPLLRMLRLPQDSPVEAELGIARAAALKAGIVELDGDDTPAAQRLKLQYREALSQAKRGEDPHDTPDYALRRRVVAQSRRAIDDLRSRGVIGDEAYRLAEEELDWLELSAQARRL
jgi:CPA1 family monovalent cation:H+ antiporter